MANEDQLVAESLAANQALRDRLQARAARDWRLEERLHSVVIQLVRSGERSLADEISAALREWREDGTS